ncbi:hypothetical protein VLJ30_003880, partial [Acinetobacter baumannii]|nr:hypothetical protein [Acinetobacter baumannii]EMC8096812.1 hypothetical protein [Acinetobacter baumannii]
TKGCLIANFATVPLFAGCPLLGGTALPFDQKCEFACDKETGHEYTIRTLVEQHNIAEAYTLKT